MSQKRRQTYEDLSTDERKILHEGIRRANRLERLSEKVPMSWDFGSMNPTYGGYTNMRGLKTRGRGINAVPGYNDLHGVDFEDVVSELNQRFPDTVLKGLDIGCGMGNFARELMDESRLRGHAINMRGTNTRALWGPRKNRLEKVPTDIMMGERLRHHDNTFHLVVSTSAATKYTRRLDLVLDQMFRVLVPGGKCFFQGLPSKKDSYDMDELHNFRVAHGIDTPKQPESLEEDAFWFEKPYVR